MSDYGYDCKKLDLAKKKMHDAWQAYLAALAEYERLDRDASREFIDYINRMHAKGGA